MASKTQKDLTQTKVSSDKALKATPKKKSLITGDLLDIDAHRRFAKAGMSVSLGALVLTAFAMKNKTVKKIHIAAGVAMVGFSLYHAGLYDNGVFKKMINSAAKKRRIKIKSEKGYE